MNKIIKIVASIVCAIFFVLFCLFLIFTYEMKWKTTTIAKYENIKNGYTVIFEEKGSPMFFGPSEVNIVLVGDKHHKVDSINSWISNDGSIIQSGNCTVNWNDLYVEVTLSGDEQQNEIHRMYYK